MLSLQKYLCLGTSRDDGDERFISQKDIKLLLATIERCFFEADTDLVASMFWTPCICYLRVGDKVLGAAQTTADDVVRFFDSLRKELQCTEMQFLVSSTLSGNTHEYGWKSDIGSGSVTVSWRRNRAGAWQIVYMDIKCNCLVPKPTLEDDKSACLVTFVECLVRQRGDRPKNESLAPSACLVTFVESLVRQRGDRLKKESLAPIDVR